MNKFMLGYDDPRSLYQIDALYKWQHGEYFPPIIAEIAPTGRCNQKCQYCYAMTRVKQEHMDNDLLMRLPKELEQAGVKAILYQGDGDPPMHKKLADAINTTNISQTISTNGVLFTPEFQDKCMDKLNYVRFSVIDSDPKRYALQHGCNEKQHQMLIENLKYAVKHRTKTMLMATIYLEPYNIGYIRGMVQFFKDLGLDYVVIMEAIYYDLSPVGKRKFTSDGMDEGDIQRLKNHVMPLNDDNFTVRFRFPNCEMKTGVTPETFKPGFCQGIYFEAVIAPNGDVIPCWRAWDKPELAFGNLHKQSFEEIWMGKYIVRAVNGKNVLIESNKRQKITDYVLNTPPDGEECRICNQYKGNQILEGLRNKTEWANFLI
jgi:cyclic pyranopterin phosphate synthase